VLQIDQDFERARDDGMRSPSRDVDHEAEPARIVLKRRVVESGSLRRICSAHAAFIADPFP
jgi:hypothetical protein